MQIYTLRENQYGETVFEQENLALRGSGTMMSEVSTLVSDPENCERFFFAELPPGTSTGFAPATRKQFCVCLSGRFDVEIASEQRLELGAGDVLRLENTSGSGHAYTVKGENAVKLLIVQME